MFWFKYKWAQNRHLPCPVFDLCSANARYFRRKGEIIYIRLSYKDLSGQKRLMSSSFTRTLLRNLPKYQYDGYKLKLLTYLFAKLRNRFCPSPVDDSRLVLVIKLVVEASLKSDAVPVFCILCSSVIVLNLSEECCTILESGLQRSLIHWWNVLISSSQQMCCRTCSILSLFIQFLNITELS